MTDKNGKRPDIGADDESTVSRAYAELKKPGPPAHLDERILAEARRAAATEDRTVVQVHRWRRWSMPAALAATVVFAVPLVVRVFDNTAGDLPTATRPALQEELRAMDPAAPGARERPLAADSGAVDAVFDDGDAGLPTALVAPADRATPLDRETQLYERTDAAAADSRALRNVAASTSAQSERTPAPPSPDPQETAGAMADQPSSSESRAQSPVDPARAEAAGALAGSPDSARPTGPPESDSARALIGGAPPEHSHRPEARKEREDADTTFAAPPDWTYSEPPTVADKYNNERPESPAARTERRKTQTPGGGGSFASLATDDSQARIVGEADTSSGIEESIIVTGSRIEPENWLVEIARLHQRGRVRTARRELGRFLTRYPDYELPAFYPLDADDAIYETLPGAGDIVPEAEAWLRGIGKTADRGDIDEARQQLAEFFGRYPDYPLPEDFPLTRDDARPIDR